ncbi:hypothetical protein SASPL_116151 [Salvia splendens]|uniref:Endoglucanase n=1 Tax=Salvia splendens TaxID=180675 RepID=A0A8X8Y8Z0_SALSN|nr:hypothetical protein SASPL_116151 [Salvia splendens]
MKVGMVRKIIMCMVIVLMYVNSGNAKLHDYGDALSKSLLFFEGQRSGKLPSTQRVRWRKDSGLRDGFDKGVDLTGGYYDAGDNVKYNFPMAFTITMMAWGVIEHGNSMGPELPHALEAVRWATDYFLKSTAAAPGIIYAQVGDPNADHNCWQRPEDMDTPRTVYAVTPNKPGTEVAAETAAALAAASLAFRAFGDEAYGKVLLERAVKVFEFADKYRGSYNDSIGEGDELLWGAAWLYKATNKVYYWNYVKKNVITFKSNIEAANFEFSWDSKHAGISVLVSNVDYILGSNPLNMSYMVGYGAKFPRRMHHRGSSIPSLDQRPDHIGCKEWFPYFNNTSPNPNELTGAVSGGPEIDDSFADARANSSKSEPTTYIVSPLVGLLAFFSEAATH